MAPNKIKLGKTLADKGVDVEKIDLDHVVMMMSHIQEAEKNLNDFPKLDKQTPLTMVDKEEINQ